MAVVLMVVGALAVVVCAALVSWQLGGIAAGFLVLMAGVDLATPTPPAAGRRESVPE